MKKNYSQFILKSPIKVARGVKLSRFCTMKVGGPADLFTTAKTKTELMEVLRLAHKLGIKYFVLAGGSNVVFPDKGWRGLVVRYTANRFVILSEVEESRDTKARRSLHFGRDDRKKARNDGKVALRWSPDTPSSYGVIGPMLRSERSRICATVEAGAMLGEMVRKLLKQGLGGFNFLANIPGSVGGAIVGNAGCYGKETKDFLEEVEIFNVKTGRISIMKPSKLGFDYRHSKLKEHPELIVLSAIFKLAKVDPKQALKEIAAEKQSRLDKHPQGPSCGSWFKNPERGVPAWKFIDQAGLRGYTLGKARISHKHSNFLVNCGGATATDIVKLSRLVKKKVSSQTGIYLTEEARLIN
ncbi:MAG: UDP-N-acetylmuramate dehydrogenase [Patescibacteria group bacterium]